MNGSQGTMDDLRREMDVLRGRCVAVEAERDQLRADLAATAAPDAARTEGQFALLLEASALLTSSLDLDATLAAITGLAVPRFADSCTVYTRRGTGPFEPFAVAHRDPARLATLRALHALGAPPADALHGYQAVLRTGQTELVANVTRETIASMTRDAVTVERIASLALLSYVIVPMRVQQRLVGAISFATDREGRGYAYGPTDVRFAEDLARRAAVALENSQLYTAAQAAGREHQLLAEAIPQIVWTARPDGTLDYCNERMVDYGGMSADSVRGWHWRAVLHPDDVGHCLERWGRAVDTGEPYEIEYRLKRASDGAYRWHLGRANPVKDATGTVVKWFGTCTDIDDLRTTEAALRASEARYRRVVESNIIGIIFWDAADITDANDEFLRMVGYTREDLCAGRVRWAQMAPAEYLARDAEAFAEVLGTGVCAAYEREYFRKDGTRVPVVIAAAKFEDRTSEGVSFVLDITTRRQAEESLRQARDELEQRVARRTADLARSNSDLGQFAYAASHDLRAPLRAIDDLSQWLEKDLGEAIPERSRRHVHLLRSRVQRMDRLLSDLLSYARAGRADGVVAAVDTARLLSDVTELTHHPAGFSIEAEGALPVMVTARAPLQQVILNLVDNAIKHHDCPPGRVRVSARDAGAFWEFTVSDDGPGIPAALHARAFQMFQTLRSRDEVETSGMGLALVKKLVESAGGAITLESVGPPDGRGATFRFTWPRTWPTRD